MSLHSFELNPDHNARLNVVQDWPLGSEIRSKAEGEPPLDDEVCDDSLWDAEDDDDALLDTSADRSLSDDSVGGFDAEEQNGVPATPRPGGAGAVTQSSAGAGRKRRPLNATLMCLDSTDLRARAGGPAGPCGRCGVDRLDWGAASGKSSLTTPDTT